MIMVFPGATAGCGGDGFEVPRGEALPPLAYVLQLTYDDHPPGGPESIDGHFHLHVSDDGSVTGAMSAVGSRAGLAAVTGVAEGSEIVLAPVAVSLGERNALRVAELRLDLGDADGDGRVDRGAGSSRGTWYGVCRECGNLAFEGGYAGSLSLGLDSSPGAAYLRSAARGELRPFDALEVVFGEPVREDDVRATLRVLAGGEPAEGTLVTASLAGLITSAVLRPGELLPFDTEIALELGGLTDVSGNAMTVAGAPLRTFADPGPALDNAGFESGLAGWRVTGTVAATGGVPGISPAEGSSLAVVSEQSSLLGYLDVPATAAALDLWMAALVDGHELDDEYTALVTLHAAAGEAVVIFDLRDERDRIEPCESCGGLQRYVAPLRRQVDLTPHRGQRVWLSVEAQTFSYFDSMPVLDALVDDVRIVDESALP